jgi:hypothetical protein
MSRRRGLQVAPFLLGEVCQTGTRSGGRSLPSATPKGAVRQNEAVGVDTGNGHGDEYREKR